MKQEQKNTSGKSNVENNQYDALIRVSTEEQKQKKNSPDAQINTIQRNSEDEELREVYNQAVGKTAKIKDENIRTEWNGKEFIIKIYKLTQDRPDLVKYLNDLSEKKVAPILKMTKWDRLSRNMIFQEGLLKHLKDNGVQPVAILDPHNKFVRRILASVNENEVDVMADRINIIHEDKVEHGKLTHRLPFGYERTGKKGDPDRKTIVNEEQAEIIRKMFKLVTDGVNPNSLASMFSMQRKTVKNILKNPFYTGKIKYKGKLYSGNHPPIISQETYSKVQEKI